MKEKLEQDQDQASPKSKKNDKQEQDDVESIYYLSSIQSNQNIVEPYENKEEEGIKEEGLIGYIIKYFVSFTTYFLILCISVVLMLIGLFIGLIVVLFEKNIKEILTFFVVVVQSSAITFLCIYFLFLNIENESVKIVYQDGFFFLISTLLVVTYLAVNTNIRNNSLFDMIFNFSNMLQLFITLTYSNNDSDNSSSYHLDYNFKAQQIQSVEYKQQKDLPSIPVNFSLLTNNGQISNLEYKITHFYGDFTTYIDPNFKHFGILAVIILFKIVFIFIHITLHSSPSIYDSLKIGVCAVVYLFIAFTLNKILGNHDLLRKTNQMKKFKEYLDFQNINKSNFKEKLDVSCPVSLETWDNARKYILAYKRDFLADLEIAYFWLLFYYFFVIGVCLAYYFEFYWLISKDSVLLTPIIVIINTFNFVFLTAFLIFRFQYGTEFNDTFEDIEQSISYLYDVISDLDTMYVQYFQQKQKNELKEERYSAYGILIKRVKLLSNNHIQNKIRYQNKIYDSDNKDNLRREIISEIKKNLEKIKLSISADSQIFKYRFLNMIEVNISDFLFTLSFALITTLPTIIPKLVDFYRVQ